MESLVSTFDRGLRFDYHLIQGKFNPEYISKNPKRSEEFYIHHFKYHLFSLPTGFGELATYPDQKRIVWTAYFPTADAQHLRGRHYSTVVHLRTIEAIVRNTRWRSGTIEHIDETATSDDFRGFLNRIGIPVGKPLKIPEYLEKTRQHAREHGVRC